MSMKMANLALKEGEKISILMIMMKKRKMTVMMVMMKKRENKIMMIEEIIVLNRMSFMTKKMNLMTLKECLQKLVTMILVTKMISRCMV